MKALSFTQPWAWLVVSGLKPVDNRPRGTKYRGPLLVHASKKWDSEGERWIRFGIGTHKLPISWLPQRQDPVIRYGEIIGMVEVVDCVRWHASPWFCGPNGLVLRNAVKFKKPFPYKGQLGLFDVAETVVRQLLLENRLCVTCRKPNDQHGVCDECWECRVDESW